MPWRAANDNGKRGFIAPLPKFLDGCGKNRKNVFDRLCFHAHGKWLNAVEWLELCEGCILPVV